MAGKQRAMVEECNGVLVLEYAKAVIIANNFAEGTVFVKCADLCAHNWFGAIHSAGKPHLGQRREQQLFPFGNVKAPGHMDFALAFDGSCPYVSIP